MIRNTNIKLLKIPLELDNKNQLLFNNANEQFNYFNSQPFLLVENTSYQRKNNIIRFPAYIDDIINYNYCMYQNENYSDKWFYAFVTDMKYINDNMTEISLTTDVFQTWQFDIIYKKMFVEREHVNDDIVGLHTLPENLETGEYIIDETKYYNGLDNYKYIIRITEYLDGTKPLSTNFGGVISARWCLYMFNYG